MKSRKRSPIWPYLAILACLFVLSVTAPRAWDRMARRQKSNRALLTAQAHKNSTIERPLVYERADASELTEREPLRVEAEAPPAPQPQAPATSKQEVSHEPAMVPHPAVASPAPEIPAEAAPPIESRTAEAVDEPVEVPKETPVAEPAAARYSWPLPRTLILQLNQVAAADSHAGWASQAADVIEGLCRDGATNRDGALDSLVQLRSLAERDKVMAVVDAPTESRIVRTRYALTRWIAIWEQAVALDAATSEVTTLTGDGGGISNCLSTVDSLLGKRSGGAGWRKYLQLDALTALAGHDAAQEERRKAAVRVLDRMQSHRLTRKQQEFIRQEPLVQLADELRGWAARPIAPSDLLTHLEAYEHSHLASHAQLVADDYQALRWSPTVESDEISQSLDTHYRNANLRVAISAELANKLVPQPGTMEGSIDDTIANVPVVGRSTTFTKLAVRFVPDPRRIRVGLEAHGVVDSDTVSSKGPATFYNTGQSTFIVQKLMVLGPQGLVVWPAVAEADSNYTYLTSLETNFDGVPLVGPLVRSIARSQLEEARGQAQSEAEYKLAKRAREQVDAEIRPLIADAAKRVEKDQLATLKGLGLDLVPVALSTTEERIVARARLGGLDQLGAHTPRPRAPADSWLSVQMHESALNNSLAKLDLDGRTFTLPELFAWIAEKLNRPTLAQQEDLPDDVQMTFAKDDAIRVRCEDGRVEVTFAFARLAHRGRSWQNFSVKTYYLPEAVEMEPRFVRGRELHFDGRSVKGKTVVLLRTIFSKVLSPNRDVSLLASSLVSDPRLSNLQITQFVVEDGWVGVAYSPRRAAGNVARRPK